MRNREMIWSRSYPVYIRENFAQLTSYLLGFVNYRKLWRVELIQSNQVKCDKATKIFTLSGYKPCPNAARIRLTFSISWRKYFSVCLCEEHYSKLLNKMKKLLNFELGKLEIENIGKNVNDRITLYEIQEEV